MTKETMGADFKSATDNKKLFIETYGCQMNVADSEVVASIMQMAGYSVCDSLDEADAVFMNTCSIRDNAEQKIINRLEFFHAMNNKRSKKNQLIVGVLGCMAERAKQDLIDNHHVDLVVGPDAYLSLPELIASVEAGEKAINVELSTTETYRDVIPSRICGNHISGFVSIMRGCNNFCHYCIVPYTRGRERSRDVESILNEVLDLSSKGYKEVTLLGQNVNSYKGDVDFAGLLKLIAKIDGDFIVRFMTSHPKDATEELIDVMAASKHIAHHFHLPMQSGNDKVLRDMNRRYDIKKFMGIVDYIREKMPDATITSDIIVGFPGETDEDFEILKDFVTAQRFENAGVFQYSQEEGTVAGAMPNQIPDEIKENRYHELMALQAEISEELHQEMEDKELTVVIEGFDEENPELGAARSYREAPEIDGNIFVENAGDLNIGDFVKVRILQGFTYEMVAERV